MLLLLPFPLASDAHPYFSALSRPLGFGFFSTLAMMCGGTAHNFRTHPCDLLGEFLLILARESTIGVLSANEALYIVLRKVSHSRVWRVLMHMFCVGLVLENNMACFVYSYPR